MAASTIPSRSAKAATAVLLLGGQRPHRSNSLFFEAAEELQRAEKLMGIERFSEHPRRPGPAANLSHQVLSGRHLH
jgi:hypothetical protein